VLIVDNFYAQAAIIIAVAITAFCVITDLLIKAGVMVP